MCINFILCNLLNKIVSKDLWEIENEINWHIHTQCTRTFIIFGSKIGLNLMTAFYSLVIVLLHLSITWNWFRRFILNAGRPLSCGNHFSELVFLMSFSWSKWFWFDLIWFWYKLIDTSCSLCVRWIINNFQSYFQSFWLGTCYGANKSFTKV